MISAVLEPVLNYTEKSCITSYYRQFTTNIKIKIIIFLPVFPDRRPGITKLVLNLTNVHFTIRGTLFTRRCDKLLLLYFK